MSLVSARTYVAGLLIPAALVVCCLFGPAAARAQDAATAPSAALATASAAEGDPLDRLVDEAITSTSRRHLDGAQHTPWQILHALLPIRRDYQIRHNGRKVNALEWVAAGQWFEGRPWFEKTAAGGRAQPYTRSYAFEGHPNQCLAYLTMSDLPLDFELQTPQGKITIADMLRHTKWEVTTRDEPTWTLWALSHYLEPDATWENKYGQTWSIEALVRLQTDESFERAACGGTHAGFALARALEKYRQTGGRLTGVWLEADQKVRRYVETARAYQNSDGSFSMNYFQSSGYSGDFGTRLQTSGHTLEFVTMALPPERFREPWIRRAIHALASDIVTHRREPVDVGSLFHAADGLVIYRERSRPRPEPDRLAGDAPSAEVTTQKPAVSEGTPAAAP